MANWEVNKTKRYNKPIEEHDAEIRGQAFRIEASEGSDKGVLYLWNDLRGYERIASGSVADLKRQAEGMGKREARGVAAIERRANYSRPGAKDTMAVDRRKVLAQLVELRDEAKRQGNRDARLTAEDHIKEARLAKTEDDWLDLQTATHYIDEMLNSRPGAKDKMAVEDRFYFGKDRFANWWAEQQRKLPAEVSVASSAARILGAELVQIANRLSANLKIVTSVKEKDLVGTNQKLHDAVYAIQEDLQKLYKYDVK